MRRLLVFALVLSLTIQFPISFGSNGKMECGCVAFRLDDVQDYFLNEAQMEIIKVFDNKSASLTVGVIGNFIGSDATLTDFLKKENSEKTIEIASHGLNHEDFTAFDKNEQSELLSKTNGRIFQALGVMPTVFIAPFNQINNDTLAAMVENSMHVVSANITKDHLPFIKNITKSDDSGTYTIYHFPATGNTGDLNGDNTQWIGFGHEEILSEIKTSIQEYGYALVTMHPQEFSVRDGLDYQNKVDMQQIGELQSLLDAIQDERYDIVTLSQLTNYSVIPEFGSLYVVTLAVAITIAYVGKRTIK